MLEFIAGADPGTDLKAVDFEAGAEGYLTGGGMTEEEISALKSRLQ